ncbi:MULTISPECIES: glycosyl hydrolase 115 family protein [Niastella]|uniref:Glycosyl hydrolase 115 family protein n=1 Tax=Niastella soli TaxID=2821487 RepID=A0ABS3YZ42_9BACT|nr:glycosyl hydrolase 115 family protein [Niastella soli]MBO9203195.1 glycosyl hydrolase 115 family protein [Niastella soli]
MNVSFRMFLYCLLLLPGIAQAQQFSFTDKDKGLQIVYSLAGPKLDSIAAHLLANDVKLVTGNLPPVITDLANAKGNVIVIGNISSPLIQRFVGSHTVLDDLHGKWECYGKMVIDHPGGNISKVLVVAGSDTRGTAFGVFSLSELLGVSPWYWWADVPVTQKKKVALELSPEISRPPTVKYRGIFINDEDWGLQPWAAKTFEPETGDIGPKTYAKVFELLLRLKANLIWPAMHPSTKAFFSYPGNKTVAEDYGIVIGSSHAEPMLRNNVGEWDEKTMGPFNYLTNKEKVYQYWESRVKESTNIDAIYTMGMRGVHDSGMEGVKNSKEAVPLLEQIIKDQRDLLEKYRGKPADSIPQVFTAYKEVLDIYDSGLKIPDDITLVWPDDNYGYIQRLSNKEEQKRSGGSGVYYHASYWGRPHDYLWLPSTHPGLMYEEMDKARQEGATQLWVLNVGDIKPLEYNIEIFFKMAYDPEPVISLMLDDWHKYWQVRNSFGAEKILQQYYQLAFERRPEFMGWSRTEPTTQTTTTQYNHFFYGDEAQQRLDKYDSLVKQVKAGWLKAGANENAAYYQMVYYPVVCAAWMNKKFLYRDKALYYAKQNRLSAFDYAAQSKAAYDSIIKETEYYNHVLSGGKWKNMMSMKPRNLPVYQELEIPTLSIDRSAGWSIVPEGFVTKDSSLIPGNETLLPAFDNINRQRYFIDVFLNDNKPVDWKATVSDNWIRLSKKSGSLSGEWGKNQVRIWVDVDWNKVGMKKELTGKVLFTGGGKQMEVNIRCHQPFNRDHFTWGQYAENNGFVCIHPMNLQTFHKGAAYQWAPRFDLGYTGGVLEVVHSPERDPYYSLNTDSIKKNSGWLAYSFDTYTAATPTITVYTIPTQPLNNKFSMRYGVSVDDGPVKVVDFKTVGRSEEWKENVLRNRAERTIQLPHLNKGRHSLKIYAIDPGVILDEIRIDLGGLKKAYSTIPPTTDPRLDWRHRK